MNTEIEHDDIEYYPLLEATSELSNKNSIIYYPDCIEFWYAVTEYKKTFYQKYLILIETKNYKRKIQ